jgi:cation transport regulator ChaC
MLNTHNLAKLLRGSVDDTSTWVFGYGSLIYKVDFPFLEREPASIAGWARRFWQGSHDHRGTPDAPGRVVTLIPSPDSQCQGVAYRITHDVFDHLDHREKNGYQRIQTSIRLRDSKRTVSGVTYYADADNEAFLGPQEHTSLAQHIAGAEGPSGRNIDYALQLAAALRELNEDDPHVFAIEALLLEQQSSVD